jgi:CRP/FNR family cyclic AMP-dependent transcriptional regulator
VILVEKVLFLRHVALFTHMASKDLGRIAEIAEEVVYPAGSTIFTEGDYGDYLLVIVEGEVRITLGEKELGRLGSEEYFGEMSLLDGEPRSASAVAETDCLLLRLGQREFLAILARNFESALTIIRTLSQRLRAQRAAGGQEGSAHSSSKERHPATKAR